MNQIAVIFKKSLYEIYFKPDDDPDPSVRGFSKAEVARLKNGHETHQRALNTVIEALDQRGLSYRKAYRARRLKYDPFDLVISVGGDGTFIEAARRIRQQPILGVNSDPSRSHGNFCATNADGFGALLDAMADGRATSRELNRLTLTLDELEQPFFALNDILAAHQSPGAMSRYRLQVGEVEEAQRGSGVWFSTAAGATGAIASAGGLPMALDSADLQYHCRELFADLGRPAYQLTGGIVPGGTPLSITSTMREGMLYVDGAHLRLPWPAGSQLSLSPCVYPLKVIQGLADS